jgi:hypothetical protein
VSHAAETAELLNIEMDDLAWFLALVAWMWLLQLEAREPAEAGSPVGCGGRRRSSRHWASRSRSLVKAARGRE